MPAQSEAIQLISETASELLSCTNRAEIAGVLLHQLSSTLRAKGGSVFQLKGGHLHRLASLDAKHVPAVVDFPIQSDTPFGRCIKSKTPIRLSIEKSHSDLTGSGWGGYENSTCLLLPMLDQARDILGIVSLHNKHDGEFDDHDLEMGTLLSTLATESMRGIAAREEAQLLAQAVDQTPDAIVMTDATGKVVYLNPAAMCFIGKPGEEPSTLYGQPHAFVRPDSASTEAEAQRSARLACGEPWKGRVQRATTDGTDLEVEEAISPVRDSDGNLVNFVHAFHDVTRESKLQSQLMQSQKMEAVGALASGIAHEINTPTQYIGDNIRFFQSSFADLAQLLEQFTSLLDLDPKSEAYDKACAAVRAQIESADLEFLLEEIPTAIEQSLEGNQRVADIVRAMKEFAHTGNEQHTNASINTCLRNTIAVSRNEWKYVAELVCDFDPELPEILCDPSALNQVFLNMIVNASHAIAEKFADVPGKMGQIRISTSEAGDLVEVRIGDDGAGMPDDLRNKIFDPFFTTKPIGKGSGQGLAISHTVVVEQHKGAIEVESTPGEGTTFIIRIPKGPPESDTEQTT